MSLSKDKAGELGLMFSIKGDARPEDPDQEIWAADLTIDGHTERFTGKSEQDILEQAEKVLIARGRIKAKAPESAEAEPAQAQESDVDDLEAFKGQRDETAEELAKEADEDGVFAPIAPGEQLS